MKFRYHQQLLLVRNHLSQKLLGSEPIIQRISCSATLIIRKNTAINEHQHSFLHQFEPVAQRKHATTPKNLFYKCFQHLGSPFVSVQDCVAYRPVAKICKCCQTILNLNITVLKWYSCVGWKSSCNTFCKCCQHFNFVINNGSQPLQIPRF